MARKPDKRIEKAKEMFQKGIKLVEIANQLGLPEGTVRRWKSTHKWGCSDKNSERSDKNNERSDKKKEIKQEAVAKEVEQVIENPDLTDKQRLFCVYYIKCFNATKAYQKAYGSSYETAMVNGFNLLRNTKIKKEIQELKQNRLNREFFSEEDLFQKYMDIAFSDITDYVTFGQEEAPVMGAFGPIQVKNEKTGKKETLTKIVNTVRLKESDNVDGTLISEVKQGKDGASIKLLDKMKAMQWLSDHMDLATEEQKSRIELCVARRQAVTGENENDQAVAKLDQILKEVRENAFKQETE